MWEATVVDSEVCLLVPVAQKRRICPSETRTGGLLRYECNAGGSARWGHDGILGFEEKEVPDKRKRRMRNHLDWCREHQEV